jgi:hypothetical protein
MAWTSQDIADIEAAIRKKAKGERLTNVDLGGRIESYADANLEDLQKLLERMRFEAPSTPHPRILRSRFEKGL